MRFFAHQQHRPHIAAARPDRVIERQPAQHRDHGRGDFAWHARYVDDRDRLAVGGHAEDLGDEIDHGVTHQHARKHELVTRIGPQFLDLGLDAHVRNRARCLVELAHFIVEDVEQVRQQVRNRRIDGDPAQLVGQPVLHPRLQQALGEDIGIDLPFTPGHRHEHLAVFLEVHQPVGHLQVRHVEQVAHLAERIGVFAVRVDHQDVAFRGQFANAVEDQRDGGRLAGAGRTEQREVLAQHVIDLQRRADIGRRKHRADLDRGATIAGVNLAQFGCRGGVDRRARHRIARNTAAEAVDPPGQPFLLAFAEEIDFGGEPARHARIE